MEVKNWILEARGWWGGGVGGGVGGGGLGGVLYLKKSTESVSK